MGRSFYNDAFPTKRDNPISPDVAGNPTRIADGHVITLIGKHPFELEVLAASLRHAFPRAAIHSYGSELEWAENREQDQEDGIVLYNIGDTPLSNETTLLELRSFVQHAGRRRVIVISRRDDLTGVLDAIDCGAVGFIPSSVGLDELVECMRNASSKSVVIPRCSVLALRAAVARNGETNSGLERHFTSRQLAVAKALRHGAANKTIAYELGLCESTVKVHIRNIMRKLRATNRTQAAFRLNELANGSTSVDVLPDD